MRLINKSWRLPGRPTHHKSSPEAIKKAFREGLRDIVKVATMQGYVCMFMDEAHSSTKTALGKTWLTKGARQAIKITMSGKKITCFGAVGLGIRDVACYDSGNTANMILYGNNLVEKYGRIMLIMDNASYHKSIAFRDAMNHLGDMVRIVYLPPYSPDLNPTETLWREIKRHMKNAFYGSVQEMISAVAGAVSGDVIPELTMPQYFREAVSEGRRAAGIPENTPKPNLTPLAMMAS